MEKFKLRKPFFVVNPKSYLYGEEIYRLAKKTDELAEKYDFDVLFTAQLIDLPKIIADCPHLVPCAQFMESLKPGRGMGHVLPEALAAAGVKATFLNHLSAAHVQKRGRLVEHEHLRLHGQCAGDAHALPLSAAHARRIGARVVGERHAGELAVHAPAGFVARKAEVLGPEGYVVGHDARHDLVVGVLEHEAEGAPSAAVGLKVGRAALAHELSHELDIPLVRGQKPADHRGERGLAAAVGAQDAYALAARHLERDVVKGAVVPVAQRNAREAHDGASLEIKVFIEAGAHAQPYPASAFETGPCTSAVRAQLRASLRTLNGMRMGRIIATTASTVTAV